MAIVKIPKFLHDIHGKEVGTLALIATYGAGLILATVAAIIFHRFGLETWQIIIIAILYFDIGSGVVANHTSSTNQHYQESTGRRSLFLFLHIIHPLVLALILGPEYMPYAIFIILFTIIGAFVVNSFKSVDSQQNAAATLTVIGVSFSLLFSVEPGVIYSFGALLMVKILTGFSVDRPDLRKVEKSNK